MVIASARPRSASHMSPRRTSTAGQSEKAPARAPDVLRHEFDTAQGGRRRRGRPAGRPVAVTVQPAGGDQPGEQDALPAAQVHEAAAPGQQAEPEHLAKDAVGRQFAARVVVGEMPAPAKARARLVEQPAEKRLRHGTPCASVTAVSDAARMSASSRGRTSAITGRPDGARAALPSCSSRMSPGARPRVSRS